MAGDWIPMRLDLYEDPAVTYMADKLQCREETIVGYLHRVWSWASRQCHDGSVTNVTLMSLGRVTNVAGFPELMRDAGWLVETQDDQGRPCVVFPKWENWMSESAKKRLQDAKRQAKRRSGAVSKSHADVTKMSRSGCDKSVTTVQDSTGENIDKKNTKKKKVYTKGFESWYASYPRKIAKGSAEKAYAKAVTEIAKSESVDVAEAETILASWSVQRYPLLLQLEEQFIPHPATWLNQGRYRDALVTATRSRVATAEDLANYNPGA